MAGSVVVSHQSNGLERSNGELQETLEYEKILKLHDSIITGTHPRLKIPSKAARKSTPPKVLSPPGPAPKFVNGTSSASTSSPALSSALNSTATNPALPTNNFSFKAPNARPNPPPKLTSSGLDPIFLEKGEDLIRAEMRLERQRIERALEEQVQQRRMPNRPRISDQDALPDFDVSDVLFQAQELVKPIAATESHGANGIASSSDSFDDITFYSSQMNDTTTDEAEEHPKRRPTKPCKYFFEGTCRKGDSCVWSHDPAFKQKLQRDVSLTMELDSQDVSQDPVLEPARRPYAQPPNNDTRRSSMDIDRGFEAESQFHGPAPGQGHNGLRDRPYHHSRDSGEIVEDTMDLSDQLQESRQGDRSRRNQPADFAMERDYSYQALDSPNGRFQPGSASKRNGRGSPPPRDVRIVRNHITSPIAPQPARVSPLAVARVPRLDQIRRSNQDNYGLNSPRQPESGNQSPAIASQPANSRKRRREPDLAEPTRNVAARRDRDSPLPYIKDEPVSPPPFPVHPVRQHSRHEQVGRQPFAIDSTPPHLTERVVYERRQAEPSHVRVAELQRLSTPVIRRVVSRPGHHYEVQEEPEIRQVYSARQPRRVLSPQQDLGHYSAPQPRAIRAVSRSYIVPSEADRQQQYRASVQPPAVSYNRMGPPRDRSLSPELRPVQYSPLERDPAIMAPPARRIMMDQYGNKYYEAPLAAEPRASVAPPQRYVNESANPFERLDPPGPRRASVHPQLAKLHDEGGYVRTVQSPAPTSPSYVEYYQPAKPVSTVARPQTYESREEVYQDRNGVVRVVEYPPQRATHHYEEMPKYRDGATRMQSVRPSTSQYELPREHIPRVQTVQPENERIVELGGRRAVRVPAVRQVSLRPDDGYERGPVYVAAERPRYQFVSDVRDAGYVGGEVQEETVMEEARSAGRRPLQRL
ncbi:hypothetical protein MMC30_006718 [Trapelia coarctata]|nr:hypothetical protein [Trapelia coarctata]